MGAKLGLVPACEFAPQKHAGLVPDYIKCASLISIIKDKYKTNNIKHTQYILCKRSVCTGQNKNFD